MIPSPFLCLGRGLPLCQLPQVVTTGDVFVSLLWGGMARPRGRLTLPPMVAPAASTPGGVRPPFLI